MTTEQLQLRLEKSLKSAFTIHGSPEYVLTWKRWDMRSGPPICALRARGRKPKDGFCVAIRVRGRESFVDPRISARGCSGLPTPVSSPANGEPEDFLRRKRESVARGHSMGISITDLQMVAKLIGLPSPKAQEDGRTLEQYESARQRGYQNRIGKTQGGPASKQGGLAIAAQLVGMPTPDHHHHGSIGPEKALKRMARKGTEKQQTNLDDVAQLFGFATPNATDCEAAGGPKQSCLNNQATGRYSTSANASMARRGALNPALSAWLMGFPSSWLMAAPEQIRRARRSSEASAMQSSQSSRRSS